MSEMIEVVRCKDCKYMMVCNAGYYCDKHHWGVVTKHPQADGKLDFFCAGGIEKNGR